MNRLLVLIPAAVVSLVSLVPLAPAFAADNVICVNTAGADCAQSAASIPAALTLANGNGVPDTIRVGPGSYSDGPFILNSAAVTLEGAGQDSTFLTLPASASSQTYVSAFDGAVLHHLTITMTGGATSSNDTGLALTEGSRAERVTVNGATIENATGVNATNSEVLSSSVQLSDVDGTRGIYGQGGNTITDTAVTADRGYAMSADPLNPDTISRVTVRAGASGGLTLDGGTLLIDDTVIDLGTSTGAGIMAANFNNSTQLKSVTADHVTIVGGGNGSMGVWAFAATPGAKQNATVELTNSIVRGPSTDLVTDAGNNGSQGGSSVAVINVSHSDYHSTGGTIGPNGTGGVGAGAGNVDVNPLFADPAALDYRLTPASPLVDQGDPSAGGPALDRDGSTRVVDGDGDGTAVRDLGAYELHDSTPPQTTVTSGPAGPTRDTTPTFGFSSEAGASFECRVDSAAFAACSGPGNKHTAGPLADGSHTFRVRATDTSGNVDPTVATRSFTVDTIAPATTITARPAKRVTQGRVKFRFSSAPGGATFACRLDRQPWRSCTSPASYRVKVGKHRFSVRAKDAAGNVDATPATHTFRRVLPG